MPGLGSPAALSEVGDQVVGPPIAFDDPERGSAPQPAPPKFAVDVVELVDCRDHTPVDWAMAPRMIWVGVVAEEDEPPGASEASTSRQNSSHLSDGTWEIQNEKNTTS